MGYLMRVADANGYQSANWLFEHSGCDPLLPRRVSNIAPLAELLGIQHEQLESMCYRPIDPHSWKRTSSLNNLEIPSTAINLKRPRVCPTCLKEKPIRRVAWDLSLIACCPKHGNILLSHCPRCSKGLSWQKGGVCRCHNCDFDLRDAHASEPTARSLALTSYILTRAKLTKDCLSTAAPAFSILDHLTLTDLIRTVLFLGAHSIGNGRGHGFWLCSRLASPAMHKLINGAAKALSDWPNNFFKLLENVRSGNNIHYTGTGLAKDFGSMYETIGKAFRGEQFSFITEAFGQYVQSYWDGGFVTSKNTRLLHCQSEPQRFVTKAQAAKALHVRPRTIDHMFDTGHIRGRRKHMGKRNLLLVEKSDVDQFEAQDKDELTFQETCTALGLSEQPVRELIRKKLIRPVATKPINRSQPYFYSQLEISGFVDNVCADAQSCIDPTDLVSMKHAVRRLSSIGFTVADIVDCALDGSLEVIGRDTSEPGLSQCLFNKTDIQNLIEQHRPDGKDVLSIPEAAIRLNLKQQVVYSLVKEGVISTETRTFRNRTIRVVKQQAIECFLRNYVAASTLANEHHTSPKHLATLLRETGVYPATGPAVDTNRQIFYLASDLKPWPLKSTVKNSRAKR